MKTAEQIKELKQVSIVGYLSGKGINPISKKGNDYLYHSPLRNDSTPSFSVSPTLNIFYDFGNETDKGSIIDLVMKLEKIGFVDACLFIENMDGKRERDFSPALSLSCRQTPNDLQGYEVTAVKDLQHPALIRYVESRKITLHTAFSYLKEIHYKNAKGQFFGVGYQNKSSGYILRSEIMKKPINLGKSDITIIGIGISKKVSVFEGVFDFLSAVEYYGLPTSTAIVLNSVSNLNKAITHLKKAEKVFTFLDNDDAGKKAIQKMKEIGLTVIDKSNIYDKFNDFNDFLVNKPP